MPGANKEGLYKCKLCPEEKLVMTMFERYFKKKNREIMSSAKVHGNIYYQT